MAESIMDAARAMVQARGYNGLSFRELAKEVGVKSASVHYHFRPRAISAPRLRVATPTRRSRSWTDFSRPRRTPEPA
jgi:DNA-directed RNA polymerase specialized sigma24 family protein